MESKKENQQKTQSQNTDPSGFNIDGLLKDGNLAELLKHLLSGAGAMAGNYFLWIKPIQDKIEILTKKVDEQEKRIKELEDDLDEAENQKRKAEQNNNYAQSQPLNGNSQEYFTLKRKTHSNMNGHYRRASF